MKTDDMLEELPADQNYYHVFIGDDIFQKKTFRYKGDKEDYEKRFPERTLVKQEGEQTHKILLQLSKNTDSSSHYENAGHWIITESNCRKIWQDISILGCSSGPKEGTTHITIYENNFEKFKKYAAPAAQTTLF